MPSKGTGLPLADTGINLAGSQGFEPRYAPPEGAVLPLNEEPMAQAEGIQPP